MKREQFDAVVIPVTNLSGTGFFNVLLFSLTIPSKRRFVCNMVSDIWEVSASRIIWMGVRHLLFQAVSSILSLLLGIFAVLFLPFGLKRLSKNK